MAQMPVVVVGDVTELEEERRGEERDNKRVKTNSNSKSANSHSNKRSCPTTAGLTAGFLGSDQHR